MFKGKKSFFTELLISFLLILCIPTITIIIFLWQSNKIVEKQILDIENQRMNLYVREMEEIIENMQEVCYSVYSTEHIKTYVSQEDKNTLKAYELRVRALDTLQSLDKIGYYYDVFVYHHDNRIFSSRYASLDASDYYATYYNASIRVDEDRRQDFLEMLDESYQNLKCHIINEGSDNAYFCMTMGTRASSNPWNNYTICVVMEIKHLGELLEVQNSEQNGVFQMYNMDHHQLFSNDSGSYSIGISEVDKQARGTWVEQSGYMVQVRESKHVDNYYVYAVSREVFWGSLRNLRIWGYLGVGLCLVISFIFAYRRARRAYQPVGNIMRQLNQRKDDNSEQRSKSEFSHILSFMEEQEKTLKEKAKIAREWFLYGLLEGKEKDIPKGISENKVIFNGEQFAVCAIHAEVLNAKMMDLCSFVVQNVFEELSEGIGRGYFVGCSQTRYALLINLNDPDTDLYPTLQRGVDFMRDHFQIILSIGYSDCHEGFEAIPEAYREAQEALRYRFLLGCGRNIAYREIRERSMGYRNEEESKVYMLLLEYIENKKENQELEEFVEQLMYIYKMNVEMSMEVASLFKNEIVSALGRIMEQCEYEKERTKKELKELKNSHTLSDFWKKLSEQISELCKCDVKKFVSIDVVKEAKRFIDENFTDGELSVAAIGKNVGMEADYLSRQFKERYGITMLDYISGVRVEQAKRILKEEKISIQEVGERTGFLSSTVFIRTFKKREGITPGKYREMVKAEKEGSQG